MATIKIKQVRSTIKKTFKTEKDYQSSWIQKIEPSIEKEATPQILGMIRKVNHLVTVIED